MTIKEKIEHQAKWRYSPSSNADDKIAAFNAGGNFAIKAVIELLEERSYHLSEMGYSKQQDECNDIIKLLKSEA